jgi:exonuclease SbcD
VDILRIPGDGKAIPPDALLETLEQLPDAAAEADRDTYAYLDLRVLLPEPRPTLGKEIAEALVGKAVRLLCLVREHTGDGRSLADAVPRANLREITPEQVFERCYHQAHEGAPSAELRGAFLEILQAVQEREE